MEVELEKIIFETKNKKRKTQMEVELENIEKSYLKQKIKKILEKIYLNIYVNINKCPVLTSCSFVQSDIINNPEYLPFIKHISHAIIHFQI